MTCEEMLEEVKKWHENCLATPDKIMPNYISMIISLVKKVSELEEEIDRIKGFIIMD